MEKMYVKKKLKCQSERKWIKRISLRSFRISLDVLSDIRGVLGYDRNRTSDRSLK